MSDSIAKHLAGNGGGSILAKEPFADWVDAAVQQFPPHPGVKVSISIEIQAKSATGFDGGWVRAVKEHCKVLAGRNAEVEAGE